MLSEDDLNLRDLSEEDLERAWDLWFELAQATNEWDPAYSHGVFVDPRERPAEASDHAAGSGHPEPSR